MGKGQEFSAALRALGEWFERQKRDLPWRRPRAPAPPGADPARLAVPAAVFYRVWVSEIMLQQTQVTTVIPYFEGFMERFPQVEDLAAAPSDEVMVRWAGLGYYSRARNLHAAAKQVVERGGFPETREGWLELPGIGPYTAGAILSIAADRPEPILDGNVERVMSRVRRVSRGHGDARYKARLWRLARIFVERGARLGIPPSQLNQALMELGATICVPRGEPACLLCPLNGICRARVAGDAQAYPPAKPAKSWERVDEVLHCWLRAADGKVLLRLRGKGEWRAGLWDFPDHEPAKHGAELLGVVETRHVVTNHKIRRVTKVWRLTGTLENSSKGASRALLRVAESTADDATAAAAAVIAGDSTAGEPTSSRWVSLEQPGVPVGSALVRSLGKVREVYGDLFPGGSE